MNHLINTDILKSPFNWIALLAMIIIVMVAGCVIYSRLTAAPVNAGASNLAEEK